MTARVVGAIAPKLEQAEIERVKRKPTESLGAYDFFLRGMASYYKFTAKDINDALLLWQRAIELDQEFACAYAMAATCYTRRKSQGWMSERDKEIAEATSLSRQAVRYGKEDPIALTFAGYTLAYVAWEPTVVR